MRWRVATCSQLRKLCPRSVETTAPTCSKARSKWAFRPKNLRQPGVFQVSAWIIAARWEGEEGHGGGRAYGAGIWLTASRARRLLQSGRPFSVQSRYWQCEHTPPQPRRIADSSPTRESKIKKKECRCAGAAIRQPPRTCLMRVSSSRKPCVPYLDLLCTSKLALYQNSLAEADADGGSAMSSDEAPVSGRRVETEVVPLQDCWVEPYHVVTDTSPA